MLQNKVRAGTTDEGKMFEWHVAELIALQLLQNEHLTDFSIATNLEGYGALDDLVLTLNTKNGKVTVAMQLKHIQNSQKQFQLGSLEATTGKFALTKYFNDFEKLSKNRKKPDYIIIYTNMQLDQNKCEKDKLQEIEIFPKTIPIEQYFNITDYNSFNFRAKKEGTFNDFLSKCYLVLSQLNRIKTEEKVAEIWKILLGDCYKDYFNDRFFKFFCKWHVQDYKVNVLTKQSIFLKIFEVLLEEFIIVPEIINDINSGDNIHKVLQETLCLFPLTVLSQHKINYSWKIILDIDDKEYVDSAKKMFMLEKKQGIEHLDNKLKAKVAAFCYGKPLFLKVNDKNRKIIDLFLSMMDFDKFRIVLFGDYQSKNKHIRQFLNFNQLSNIDQDLYSQILNICKVSIQGRPTVNLKQLFESGNDLRETFTMNELIDGCLTQCEIGEKQEDLPKPYIQRRIPVNVIELTDLKRFEEICIIECAQYYEEMSNRFTNLGIKYTTIDNYSAKIETDNNIYLTESFDSKIIKTMQLTSPIHHLTYFNSNTLKLSWTYGSRDKITQMTKIDLIEEYDIFNKINDSIMVFCAVPGMGKSVLLKALKYYCPINYWTIKLNFESIREILKDSQIDPIKVIEYYRKTLNGFDETTKNIFENYLVSNKIMILLDGLDELRDDKLIRNALKYIKEFERKKWKQIICSRTHLLNEIENELEIITINLQEFDENDQTDYIEKRLIKNKTIEEIKIAKKWIFENFYLIDNSMLLGIPLQLFMITEIYREAEIDTEINFQTLATIYGKYFSKKLNECVEFKRGYSTDKCLEEYQIVALRTIIKTDQLESNLSEDLFDDLDGKYQESLLRFNSGDPLGIIIHCNSATKSIEFGHISYAEYFVASWMATNYKRKFIKRFKNFIFDENYRNIRFLFDLILTDNQKGLVDILYKKSYSIDSSLRDRAGRSPQHLLCGWGIFHPQLQYNYHKLDSRIIIEKINDVKLKNSEIKRDITAGKMLTNYEMIPDPLFQLLPTEYVNSSRSLAIIAGMAHEIATKDLDIFEDAISIIHYSLTYGYNSLLENYIDILPNIYYKDYKGYYHCIKIALENNNFETAQYIFEKCNGKLDQYLYYEYFENKYFKENIYTKPSTKLLSLENIKPYHSCNKNIEWQESCKIYFIYQTSKNVRHWRSKYKENDSNDKVKFVVANFAKENRGYEISIMQLSKFKGKHDHGKMKFVIKNSEFAKENKVIYLENYDIIKYLISHDIKMINNFNDDLSIQLLRIILSCDQNLLEENKTICVILENIDKTIGRQMLLSIIDNSNCSNKIKCFIIKHYLFSDVNYFIKIHIIKSDSVYSIILNWINEKTNELIVTTVLRNAKQEMIQYLSKKCKTDIVFSENYATAQYEQLEAQEIFQYMMEQDEDISWNVDVEGHSVSSTAISNNCKVEVVKCLLKYEDDSRWINPATRDTLLMLALKKRVDIKLVQYLITNCNIKINELNIYNESAFFIAIANNCKLNIIKYLKEQGAEIKGIKNLLLLALQAKCDIEIVRFLVEECRIFINSKHILAAISKNHKLEVVKYLMENGSITEFHNAENDNLLTLALRVKADLELIQYLIEKYNTNLNKISNSGESALSIAILSNCKLDIIMYLVLQRAKFWTVSELLDLFEYICNENFESIRYMIEERKIEINAVDEEGDSALSYAISNHSKLYVIKYLVEHGADVKWRNKKTGDTLLIFGLKCEADLELIQYLVEIVKIDINAVNVDGLSALAAAIVHNYEYNVINYLIKHGADVNWRNPETGDTLLLLALESGVNLEIVQYLVEKIKMNINAVNVYGLSSLSIAISFNCKYEVITYLVDHGADVTWGNPKTGDNLLMLALELRVNPKIIQYLVEIRKIDINAVNVCGASTLSIAISFNWNHDIITYLVEHGADVYWRNSITEDTLLILAINCGANLKIVRYLVEKMEIDINAVNSNGESALSIAISSHCEIDMIEYLLGHGADVNWKNPETGDSLLLFALQRKANLEIIRYLIEKEKMDIGEVNVKGASALSIAISFNCNSDVITYLIEHGADVNWRNPITGDTLLILALKRRGNLDIVPNLIQNVEIDINAVNVNGESALSAAI